MTAANQASPSSSAQLAAFEAIQLRCAAAADRVVARAVAISEGERHSAEARGHRGAAGQNGNLDEAEDDEVQGWLR